MFNWKKSNRKKKMKILIILFMIFCLNAQLTQSQFPSVYDKRQDETITFLLSEVEQLKVQLNKLYSGHGRANFKLTRVLNGIVERKLVGHTDQVVTVIVLPDQSIASGDVAGEIFLWNSNDGLLIKKLKGHSGTVRSLVATSDGRLISGSSDKTIMIWNPNTGEIIKTLKGHTDKVKSLALIGGRLVSGSSDHSVRIWDINSGIQLNVLKGHKDTVKCLAPLEGNRLASGDEDNTLKIWSLADNTELKSFAVKNLKGSLILDFLSFDVLALAALPNNRLASTIDSSPYEITIWSTQNYTAVNHFKSHTDHVESLRLMNDEQTLASGSKDKTIKLWNIDTGKLVSTFKGHTGSVLSLDVLEDGRLVSSSEDKSVIIWK